jgi:hypothetical protein
MVWNQRDPSLQDRCMHMVRLGCELGSEVLPVREKLLPYLIFSIRRWMTPPLYSRTTSEGCHILLITTKLIDSTELSRKHSEGSVNLVLRCSAIYCVASQGPIFMEPNTYYLRINEIIYPWTEIVDLLKSLAH